MKVEKILRKKQKNLSLFNFLFFIIFLLTIQFVSIDNVMSQAWLNSIEIVSPESGAIEDGNIDIIAETDGIAVSGTPIFYRDNGVTLQGNLSTDYIYDGGQAVGIRYTKTLNSSGIEYGVIKLYVEVVSSVNGATISSGPVYPVYIDNRQSSALLFDSPGEDEKIEQQNQPITFDWHGNLPYGTYYYFELRDLSNTLITDAYTGTTSNYTLNSPTLNTGTYKWRVQHYTPPNNYDPMGNDFWEFDIISQMYNPSISVCKGGVGNGQIQISYSASGAEGFKIYYGTTSGGPYDGSDADIGSSPVDVGYYQSKTLSNLTNGTTYYFKVKSYNSIRETDFSYENYATPITTSGTISQNQTWPGSGNPNDVNVTGSITVSSGATLTVNPGTSVNFGSSNSLTINGNLSADGVSNNQIIFKGVGSSGTWYGIYFSSDSDGDLEYCTIKNVQKYGGSAVTINDASPSFWYCTVEDNSGYCNGISINNYSYPSIFYCTIEDNSAHGIYIYNSGGWLVKNNILGNSSSGRASVYCSYYSNPVFFYPSYPYFDGRNSLKDGYYGIYASNHSSPDFGSAGYNNRILSNGYANAYATGSSDIDAEDVWWGQYPPDDDKIISVSGSVIDYDPALESDPGAAFKMQTNTEPIAQNSSILMKETSPNDSPTELLFQANDLKSQQEYSQAEDLYKQIISDWPKSDEAIIAMNHLGFLYQKTKDEALIDYFKSFTVDANNFTTTALEVLVNSYSFDNNFKEAFEINNKLLKDYPGTIHEKNGLNNQFYIHVMEKQYDLAEETLTKLKQTFPDDENTAMASSIMKFEKDSQPNESESISEKPSSEEASANNIILESYPNPFNPTTTIKYKLPEKAYVNIAVYNLQGRLVKQLVDKQLEAGHHSVLWNAVDLPSGMYICKIITGNIVATRKMTLLK